MKIICGTDFSAGSAQAADVAAALARRGNMPLLLVHVREPLTTRAALASRLKAAAEDERRLHEEAARLRAIASAVRPKLLTGFPEEELTELAAKRRDAWLVLGAHGARSRGRWWMGSVAERVAAQARVPVLIVRHSEPLLRWLGTKTALRVVLAINDSLPSRAAANWLQQWCTLGRCSVTATRIVPSWTTAYWLQASAGGAGLGRSWVEKATREEVASLLPAYPPGTTVTTHVQFAQGPAGAELVELAEETKSDLLVVGRHQHSLLEHALHSSVSGVVVRSAQTNVAVVPVTASKVPHLFMPHLRNIVVATDLSALSNQAIPYAYAVAQPGGTVTLVHVLTRHGQLRKPSETARYRAALRQLSPAWAGDKGVATRVEVVVARDVVTALTDLTRQLRADLLCLTSHGRGGLRHTLGGSVARAISKSCAVPLLLLRPSSND